MAANNDTANSKTISNPLVLIIGLSKYDNIIIKKNIDLPFVKKDVELFTVSCQNHYGFTICPSEDLCKQYHDKQYWSKCDILSFLEEARENVFKFNHDGIILYFSGHGGEGTIWSSDMKEIKTYQLQNKISGIWKFSVSTIPKLCIWDCCRGIDSDPTVMVKTINKHEIAHKDELFCSLYGNTIGAVSKGNENGSFFTRALCEALCDSLKTHQNIDITDLSINIKQNLQRISKHQQLIDKQGDPVLDKYLICKNKSEFKESINFSDPRSKVDAKQDDNKWDWSWLINRYQAGYQYINNRVKMLRINDAKTNKLVIQKTVNMDGKDDDYKYDDENRLDPMNSFALNMNINMNVNGMRGYEWNTNNNNNDNNDDEMTNKKNKYLKVKKYSNAECVDLVKMTDERMDFVYEEIQIENKDKREKKGRKRKQHHDEYGIGVSASKITIIDPQAQYE